MAYPLAEQRQLQKETNSHSAIDDLIATNDLKQFSDSDKNRLYEFLFGPQDMELDMGFAPDLSFSPFVSKKGIMSTLKNLFEDQNPNSQLGMVNLLILQKQLLMMLFRLLKTLI